jgi:predicted CoA-binding protein
MDSACCWFSRIGEDSGATGLIARQLLGRGWSFLPGLLRLVAVEPAFEEGDGGDEVVVEAEEQVDVVGVFLAAEAVPDQILIAVFPKLRL